MRRALLVGLVAVALLAVVGIVVVNRHVTAAPRADWAFEHGGLAGWVRHGRTGLTGTQPHGGKHAARVGGTAGDSSIADSFTVPAGRTRLTFWYRVGCPDPAHRAWAVATLVEAGAAPRSALAPACTTGLGWQRAAAGVLPGHRYTLTLATHGAAVADYDDVGLDAPVPTDLTRVSADTLSAAPGQHATEAEPDTLAWGTTVVAAAQVGRHVEGAADGIAAMTSTDGGITWSDTLLPALTTANGGRYRRASDPVVGYDARHGTWLVSDIAIVTEDTTDLTVSRSADARTWQPPVKVAGDGKMFYDKDWIACDNSAASPWYGTCYLESDVFSDPNADYGEVVMNRSTDGGLTWSPPVAAADRALGLGGQPMVRPDGTAVVPYVAPNSEVRAIRSADGGASWTASVRVSDVQAHRPAGGLRTGPSLPSADVDAAGRLYLAWMDCRFRSGCPGNDIVYATSDDGVSWSAPHRVPPAGDADAVLPGLAADPTGPGHLALYYYTVTCAPDCRLAVGYRSSVDGGGTWTAARTVAEPFALSLAARTGDGRGRMVGDYISCSVVGGSAVSVFALARPAAGGGRYDQAMYSAGPLPVG